jgi:hypothetical protein
MYGPLCFNEKENASGKHAKVYFSGRNKMAAFGTISTRMSGLAPCSRASVTRLL